MQTEFKYIDDTMINTRRILKDLEGEEIMQLELIYQLRRIADAMENKEK